MHNAQCKVVWDCDNISGCHGRSSVQSITLQGAARDVALAVIVAIAVMGALILVIVASRVLRLVVTRIHKNYQEFLKACKNLGPAKILIG